MTILFFFQCFICAYKCMWNAAVHLQRQNTDQRSCHPYAWFSKLPGRRGLECRKLKIQTCKLVTWRPLSTFTIFTLSSTRFHQHVDRQGSANHWYLSSASVRPLKLSGFLRLVRHIIWQSSQTFWLYYWFPFSNSISMFYNFKLFSNCST